MQEEVKEKAQPDSSLAVFIGGKCSGKSYDQLLEVFSPFFEQAKQWEEKAKALVVNSSEEVDKMKDARTARLAIVKVRTSIEKKRLELNEDAKKHTKTVNAIADFLKYLIEPTEEHLLEQERFAQNEALKKEQELLSKRLGMLEPYSVDTQFMDLAKMPEETFQNLVENSRLLHEAKLKKEAEEKEISDRLAKIQTRRGELIRIGFYAVTELNDHFKHNDCSIEVTLTDLSMSDLDWLGYFESVKMHVEEAKLQKERAAQIEADRLAQENARLKAEKEEQERKEAAQIQKHNTAISRLEKLQSVDYIVSYEVCAEMSEEYFLSLYKEVSDEFRKKKNEEFVKEQKKKFEEAEEKRKQKEDADEKRRLELAPDKEKLKLWLNSQLMTLFDAKSVSEDSKKIALEIESKFKAFNKWANELIDSMN